MGKQGAGGKIPKFPFNVEITVCVLLLFLLRHWGSLSLECSGSSVVSFTDWVKPLDLTPINWLWACSGLSGWSKNFNQPQATPQYLHSLQLISDSLAAIGLPQPHSMGRDEKLQWISDCKCTYIQIAEHIQPLLTVHISYYCSAKKCRGNTRAQK